MKKKDKKLSALNPERRRRTYVVDEAVKNLLYQALLGDELCLSIDLSLHLLQVPVDQLALLQRALVIHCQTDTGMSLLKSEASFGP